MLISKKKKKTKPNVDWISWSTIIGQPNITLMGDIGIKKLNTEEFLLYTLSVLIYMSFLLFDKSNWLIFGQWYFFPIIWYI